MMPFISLKHVNCFTTFLKQHFHDWSRLTIRFLLKKDALRRQKRLVELDCHYSSAEWQSFSLLFALSIRSTQEIYKQGET